MSAKKNVDKDSSISDVIKKVVSIGVGAAFMTEDAVKTILSDLPLPKDIISGLISNAKNAKEDFTSSLREEVRSYLSKVDPKSLVDDVIKNYDFEVKASVSLKPKAKNAKKSSDVVIEKDKS